MPRGGRRAGAPGRAYGERSDLNQNRTLPVQTAPGQPYGAASAQANAQRAVPLATQPVPAAPSSAPAGASVPTPGAVGAPTPIVPLTAPTMRPDEHVTTSPPIVLQPTTVGDLLRSAAAMSPDVAQLYDYLSGGGQ